MTLRIIAGTFKGRLLKAPQSSSTRPTQSIVREAVFNICQSEIAGARFLDLYAGSGAMGFEALSRGASHTTFVEQNRKASSVIQENIALLHVESQTTLLPLPANRALSQLTHQSALFDLIYIDPPYDTPIDPLLESLLPLLAPQATLFLEERYNPKSIRTTSPSSRLHFQNSRHFGTALLSIFKL